MPAPSLFGNAQLRNANNLRFAYNAIANDGVAAFDEYVNGADDRLTMWAALPGPVHAAVWLIVAIVGLALIGANVRSHRRIFRAGARARLIRIHRRDGGTDAPFHGTALPMTT